MKLEKLTVFDCEVYPNFFLIAFKDLDTGKVCTISIKDDEVLDSHQKQFIDFIFRNRLCFGFNNRNFDLPIILYAMAGKSTYEIHLLCQKIIKESLSSWQTLRHIKGVISSKWKWFDIQEVAPGMGSLKLYGARFHADNLLELPYDPMTALDDEQQENVTTYCINDLDLTIGLYNKLKEQMELRGKMTEQYGEDMMSKSDAQIAEMIIKSKFNVSGAEIKYAKTFKYRTPDFISFKSDYLKGLLNTIRNIDFTLDGRGSVKLPAEIAKEKIIINNNKYTIGIGGLHSCEKSITYKADDDCLLIDKDVASYYPSIILNCGLYPKQLGIKFLAVYRAIVQERLRAKRNKDKVTNESLKIVINGSFGKFGSKYSKLLYAPDLMIQVTITGQLCLLMLIERLEENDITVISANTDGIVSQVPKDKVALFEAICFDWELLTNFELEGTQYKSYHSRDVNNYLAVKPDGSKKGKGIFTATSLNKNPAGDIVFDAVVNYLVDGKPVMDTLRECKDIRKFIYVRSVTGGANWKRDNSYVGKVVRWVYSTEGDSIHYVKNGNRVPKSEGAYPVRELIELPDHIDYAKYEEEALEIIKLVGCE